MPGVDSSLEVESLSEIESFMSDSSKEISTSKDLSFSTSSSSQPVAEEGRGKERLTGVLLTALDSGTL
jgi:hypothetical protein